MRFVEDAQRIEAEYPHHRQYGRVSCRCIDCDEMKRAAIGRVPGSMTGISRGARMIVNMPCCMVPVRARNVISLVAPQQTVPHP